MEVMSTVVAKIVTTALVEHRSNPYTVYIIDASDGSRQWTMSKRFSNFRSLHEALSTKFGKHQVPPIPPRSLALHDSDAALVRKRKVELDAFLERVLGVPALRDSSEARTLVHGRTDGRTDARAHDKRTHVHARKHARAGKARAHMHADSLLLGGPPVQKARRC